MVLGKEKKERKEKKRNVQIALRLRKNPTPST